VGQFLNNLLKAVLIISLLLASGSVAYYYLRYIPDRDARLDAERRATEVRVDAERKAERREAEAEKAANEQRQAAERATAQQDYARCLVGASDAYRSEWATTCKTVAANIARAEKNCVALGLSKTMCAARSGGPNPSPNCALPTAVAAPIGAEFNSQKDRCLHLY
jgi:hypothetical protein